MRGPTGRLFLDVILVLVAVLLLLPREPDANPDAPLPGEVIVEVRWPDHSSADVDLWVRGPDNYSIGYSNKNGPLFDLLRDDLGQTNDQMDLNFEFAFSRGVMPGEYAVNIHLFSLNMELAPIPVTVAVYTRLASGNSVRIFEGVFPLQQSEERTVVRFTLDESGKLMAGSMHDTPTGIRHRGRSAP